MIRTIIRAVLSFALRLFFSRIEVEGGDALPADRAVIFVLNHPNGLVDPLFLLCLSPRRVSFLAKEPLFRTPLIGPILRALDCLPVYRRVDQADPRKNAETFTRARDLLERGGAIAIFPEGTTHSDSKLRPLKTGAARIALGAAAHAQGRPISIIPAGLYYTNKGTFRSKALLVFGSPIDVPVIGGADEPPRAAVTALSEQIRDGLMAVTVNADNDEALAWVMRAQRVFTEPDDGEGALTAEFTLRRRFVEGYAAFERAAPERLRALEQRVEAYEREAAQVGVVPDRIPLGVERVPSTASQGVVLGLMAVPAAFGVLLNGPVYHAIGYISNRIVAPRDSTVVSTVKLCASLLVYPVLWSGVTLWALAAGGGQAALLSAGLCPLCAWCAVQFEERWNRLSEIRAPVILHRADAARFERLRTERTAIHTEIIRVGEHLEGSPA